MVLASGPSVLLYLTCRHWDERTIYIFFFVGAMQQGNVPVEHLHEAERFIANNHTTRNACCCHFTDARASKKKPQRRGKTTTTAFAVLI